MIRQQIIGIIDNIARKNPDKPAQTWMAGVRIFHHVQDYKTGDITIYRPLYNVCACPSMDSICSTFLRRGDLVLFHVRERQIRAFQFYEIITFDLLMRKAWNKILVDGHSLNARMAGANIQVVTDRRGVDDGTNLPYLLDDPFFQPNPDDLIQGFN